MDPCLEMSLIRRPADGLWEMCEMGWAVVLRLQQSSRALMLRMLLTCGVLRACLCLCLCLMPAAGASCPPWPVLLYVACVLLLLLLLGREEALRDRSMMLGWSAAACLVLSVLECLRLHLRRAARRDAQRRLQASPGWMAPRFEACQADQLTLQLMPHHRGSGSSEPLLS